MDINPYNAAQLNGRFQKNNERNELCPNIESVLKSVSIVYLLCFPLRQILDISQANVLQAFK